LIIIADTNFFIIPEVLHVLFDLAAGSSVHWSPLAEVISSSAEYRTGTICGIIAFVALQALALWGLGTIRLDRAAKWRWRTVSSFIPFSALAGALSFGAYYLLVVLNQITHNNFTRVNLFPPIDRLIDHHAIGALLGSWVVWLILGLVYWRGAQSTAAIIRILKTLLVASWIEFSLALPIDIAARNRTNECYCAAGSWIALLMIVPALILLFGPGLYLIYLGEHTLAAQDRSRARRILWRKTKLKASREIKVETHVSNARTLSLIAIPLGFVGIQLGIFNVQRGDLFNEARELVLIRYLNNIYGGDEAVLKEIQERNVTKADGPGPIGGTSPSLIVPESPFGRLEIETTTERPKPRPVRVLGFRIPQQAPGALVATVYKNFDKWKTRPFTITHAQLDRLDRILADLEITSTDETKLISLIREKLYNRHIKLPGVDFWDFNTESAVWIVALLCAGVLVALESSLRQVFQGEDGGIAEPWLILDAEAFGERAVGAVWLVALVISGWLSTFGLILSVVDRFVVEENAPSPFLTASAYGIFLVILGTNTWSGVGIFSDLLQIRDIRRRMHD
jgi:hypothetical protein